MEICLKITVILLNKFNFLVFYYTYQIYNLGTTYYNLWNLRSVTVEKCVLLQKWQGIDKEMEKYFEELWNEEFLRAAIDQAGWNLGMLD